MQFHDTKRIYIIHGIGNNWKKELEQGDNKQGMHHSYSIYNTEAYITMVYTKGADNSKPGNCEIAHFHTYFKNETQI